MNAYIVRYKGRTLEFNAESSSQALEIAVGILGQKCKRRVTVELVKSNVLGERD